MTASSSHRLDGLEPDNLLAFLSLLGLLRALEMIRPECRPRTYWDLEKSPIRPVLTTKGRTTRDEICRSALEGLLIFRKALWPFSWPRSKDGHVKKTALLSSQSRQRSLAKRCVLAAGASPAGMARQITWKLRCDVLACSGARYPTDSSSKSNLSKKDFEPTPLKLPSGQMTFIGAQYDLLRECSASDILKCLFQTWAFECKGSSLRLSPDEARRYAYRASDPSPEGSRTELGASALSCLGLLAFDASPIWRMVAYNGSRSEGTIAWAIWDDLGHLVSCLRNS
jgi:hypothetical protein